MKDTLPNSGQDFAFTTTGDRLSDFALDDDTDPTLPNSVTFTDLTPGQFSIAEAGVPGYAITGLTCDTPNYGATADTIFVNLNSGDNVTCTFTNTEYGSITLVENAVADTPADQGQDFTFFTSFGNFALDDDTDPTLPNSQTFGDLLPGQYTLFEGLGLPGWALTGLTCGPGGTVDLDTGVANVDLVAGADVTCTYTNTQSQASLTIVKDTLPNSGQDFSFTTTGDRLSDFTLDDDTDPTLSDRITFTDLTPGQFSIAEAAVPGYAITGLTCDTPNYGANRGHDLRQPELGRQRHVHVHQHRVRLDHPCQERGRGHARGSGPGLHVLHVVRHFRARRRHRPDAVQHARRSVTCCPVSTACSRASACPVGH